MATGGREQGRYQVERGKEVRNIRMGERKGYRAL